MEGTEYDMFFNDTPLKDVIKKMEGKFNIKISLNDQASGNELFTANLTDQSLSNSLNILKSVLNITYEQKGDKITVYNH
jgi:ferric-dicitrate binding protein FerR (iron transport regulator)